MRILYATDGSKHALAGGQLLAVLPLDPDCQLTITTVLGTGEAGEGRQTFESAREALRHSQATVRTEARRFDGNAAVEILRAAEVQQADLVVVGSCGHSAVARFLVGSVAERIARHAHCPVLVARPLQGELREVVLGIDGSEGAQQAAEWLQQLPLPADSEVRMVTVVPPPGTYYPSWEVLPAPIVMELKTLNRKEREEAQRRLEALADGSRAAGRRATTELRSGDPALALIQVSEDQGADLIVAGSHGLGMVERFLLGSVSEKVVRHAHCSVLVVK